MHPPVSAGRTRHDLLGQGGKLTAGHLVGNLVNRLPGAPGARVQQGSDPTIFRYSWEVAQRTKSQAASRSSLPALILRFHHHSQPEPVVSLTGART
jgi:hypothetical protein